jgi:hypothetical protein
MPSASLGDRLNPETVSSVHLHAGGQAVCCAAKQRESAGRVFPPQPSNVVDLGAERQKRAPSRDG